MNQTFQNLRGKYLENKPCINNSEQCDDDAYKKFIKAAPEWTNDKQDNPARHRNSAAGLKNRIR
jgi:hypothetical protein